MTPAEMARLEALEEVAEWSRQVRITIRGIDGQAKRRVHVSHFNGVTEEIIDGYELGTGLWHRLLGLLSSCPISEGTNASHGSGGQVQNNAGEQALDTVPSGRTSSRTLLAPAPAAPSPSGPSDEEVRIAKLICEGSRNETILTLARAVLRWKEQSK